MKIMDQAREKAATDSSSAADFSPVRLHLTGSKSGSWRRGQ
jgi:hypothetical protein